MVQTKPAELICDRVNLLILAILGLYFLIWSLSGAQTTFSKLRLDRVDSKSAHYNYEFKSLIIIKMKSNKGFKITHDRFSLPSFLSETNLKNRSNRSTSWQILSHFDIPDKAKRLRPIKHLFDILKNISGISKWPKICQGVKFDLLFNLFFDKNDAHKIDHSLLSSLNNKFLNK